MLQKLNLENLLFLDIETVPETEHYSTLSEEKKLLWKQKTKYQRKEEYSPEAFYDRAGIWAEFGKIVCISVGYFAFVNSEREFRVTSFYGEEPALLLEFKTLIETHFSKPKHLLCAHNGKEFDFPYLCRRILANAIEMPEVLDLAGKKPWDIQHLDTMQLWKFGDFKSYTSLDLLAAVFDLPTPKDDLDGSMINDAYYQQNDLERIKKYCEKDVVTLASIFLRMNSEPALAETEISVV